MIRQEAWPFYRTISGVRLCWELEEPEGPKGSVLARVGCVCGKWERESSLLTTDWSGSTDVFGVPALRHGSLNPLFQVA